MAFARGLPFAKRWARQTDFSALPEKKDSATTGMAIPPTGNNALFNQPGIASRRKKKRKAVCTCKAATGAPGERIAPGITRIRGNLCNVHGRYGPCDSGASGKKPKGRRAAKPKKPAKAKLTPEQRAQARDAEHQANRGKVLQALNIASDGQQALEALRSGAQPDPKALERGGFEQAGLVEQAQDGSYRLTSSGRAMLSAANQGDVGRAGDIISGARDRTSARTQRQSEHAKRQQETATRRAQTQANREQAAQTKKPAKAGSGDDKKRTEQAPAKVVSPRMPKRARPARSSAPSGAAVSIPKPSPKPKPVVEKPAKPAKPQLAQPLKDAAQALSEGADVTDEQIAALVRNGLAKLNKDGEPILTAAGQRATMKAETYGGVKRANLNENVFAGPDRSFPIKTAQDVKDAVRSLGRTKHDKAAVKAGIIRRARAIGAMDALPEDWKSGKDDHLFTVYKDSAGADRWLAITTTAYEDKDREIISTNAIKEAVMIGDATQDRGPLLYWHVPGLALGDCDFQAQGGPGGRFLIEGGTFRSKAFAQLGKQLSDSGYQMSPGFIHGDDQPQNGVYDHILIYERSAVPNNRAANYFTRYATAKEDRVLPQEKIAEYREKAAGNPEALALLDTLLTTAQKEDDNAQARNVVFKEANTKQPYIGDIRAALKDAPVYVAPDGSHGIIVNGTFVVLQEVTKAAPPMVEGSPEEEASEPADEAMAEGDEQMDDGGGMDDAAFAQMIAQAVVQAITPLLDIEKKMGAHMADLKSALGGYAQKDDAAAAHAATQQQIATLEAKLKELTGDLPDSVMNGARNIYRPSESASTLLTLESAAKVKEQITNIPTGLTDPAEVAAYQLIFGNS